MRNFQSSLLTCLFLTCFFFAQAQTQEQEPNNDVTTANILPLNGNGAGSIEASGVDWWKVQTDADGKLDITIQNQGSAGRINLQLYDSAAMHFIDSFSVNTGATATFSTDGLGAGVYCIKLSCEQSVATPYIVSDTLIKAAGINDPEPADIRIVPAFNLNDTVSGHIGYYHNGVRDNFDVFQFSTRYDGNIYVTFFNNSISDTLDCEISDSAAGLNGAFVPPGRQVDLTIIGMEAGTYRIQVANDILGMLNNRFGPYSFTTRMDSVTHPNDVEPNDKPKQALQLPINSSTPGHILFYYNGRRDFSDWYKVMLPEDGMFKISLSSDSNWGRMYFDLYDRDAKTLLKKGAANPLKKADFYTDGLAAGTYFIEITQRRYDFNINTYTLWDSLFTYAYAADSLKEKNNQPYKAANIVINKPVQGHVGFYYNNKRDSTDWWKLNYSDASGKLRLYLKLLPALIDNSIRSVQLQLYSDTLAAPVYSGAFNDSVNTVTLSKLPKGLYYIKLNCLDTAGFSAYALKAGGEAAVTLSATAQSGKSLLAWTATEEEDIKGYEVEKSNDGVQFSTIGYVTSKTSAGPHQYSYSDFASSNSKYYRLKQVSKTGSYEYSSIASAQPQNFQWYVLSNGNNTEVQLHLNEQSSVMVQVISANGTVITKINKGKLYAGNYSIPLNLGNKSSGIYTIKMFIDKTVSSKQFLNP